MTTIEDVRRFWDARPCNVRHSPAPVGSERWSREVTERKYFVEPHIPGFAQFERWRGKFVLEVGCGIGTDTLEFVKAGAWVDAVDISMASAAITASRLGSWITGNKYPIQYSVCIMNAEEMLPSTFGGYDLAYSFGVLHHTVHTFQAARRIRERLKPGGEFRLMLYAKWSLKNLLGDQPEAQAGCPIAKVYTARQARALLEEAGFEVLSTEKTHIFPYRVEDYKKYDYVRCWPYRVMPGWLFRRLERWLGWHLLIVARKPELRESGI
jgi:SAM-dependent methyltransferase